jgi:hypothetical protein
MSRGITIGRANGQPFHKAHPRLLRAVVIGDGGEGVGARLCNSIANPKRVWDAIDPVLIGDVTQRTMWRLRGCTAAKQEDSLPTASGQETVFTIVKSGVPSNACGPSLLRASP